MSFNFNRKTVFLTYAQSDCLTKEDVLAHWKAKHELSEYIVALERHQDGSPHIHAYLHFQKQVHTRNERYFDLVSPHCGKQFHPNIKTPSKADAKQNVKQYCIKGGDYIASCPVMGKREQLMQDFAKEGLTKKFVKENPSIMTMNFSSLMAWSKFLGHQAAQPEIRTLPKKRHLWITGPSNTGKTIWLKAFIQVHEHPNQIPINNDFQFCSEETDLLYIDEFKGSITLQTMNAICDGRFQVNTKGSSLILGYPLVVIVSNFYFEQIYTKVTQVEKDAFHNRFNVFDSSLAMPSFNTYATREL